MPPATLRLHRIPPSSFALAFHPHRSLGTIGLDRDFSNWLVVASDHPAVWRVGVLRDSSGTNIGATILLTKVIRHATLSAPTDTDVNLEAFNRSAALALAVSSNIILERYRLLSAPSLAGLLWKQILNQKGIHVNIWLLVVMTGVGLGIVSAEMAVLF